MRLVSGVFCNRRLATLPARITAVKPTMENIREAIFNVLVHHSFSTDWRLSESNVVDACAGTGAMGLEALSRGAAHITFIDNATIARSIIRTNIQSLGVEKKTRILACNVLRLPPADTPCTLAFLDPPYNLDIAGPTLLELKRVGWLSTGALCVLECRVDQIKQPIGFSQAAETRIYGKTAVLFLWST